MLFRKAGRVISIKEQEEELKKLKKEVDKLRTSVSKETGGDGGDNKANMERQIAKMNREHDEVIKDMFPCCIFFIFVTLIFVMKYSMRW